MVLSNDYRHFVVQGTCTNIQNVLIDKNWTYVILNGSQLFISYRTNSTHIKESIFIKMVYEPNKHFCY